MGTRAGAALAAWRRSRWTAVGFILGSFLFAAGVPVSLGAATAVVMADWIFFAGSIFFTTAGMLQFLTSRSHLEPVDPRPHEPTWLATVVRPRTLDWTASAIQLLGTVAFNVTTLLAALDVSGLRAVPADTVWRPDAFGSVMFLVSSGLAFIPEVRERRHTHVRGRSWAIGALNLLGSVFFALSAVGAYTLGSGQLVSVRWADLGTFAGAVCFLAGAALLLPRRQTRPDPSA